MTGSTMRALQQRSLDGPQGLRLITDAPVPSPGAGEVLIRVTAAGVNFVDISQGRGTFAGGPRPPYVAGIEDAGEVVAVGDAVTSPASGARVSRALPDRVALVQRQLGRILTTTHPVRMVPCPFEAAPLVEALWWHPMHGNDTGHRWLRHLFVRAARHLHGTTAADGVDTRSPAVADG